MKITKSQLQRIIKEELQQVMEQERSMAQQIARDDRLQSQAAEQAREEAGYELYGDMDTEMEIPARAAELQRGQGYEVRAAPTSRPASMQDPKEREVISRRRGLRGPAAQQTQRRYDADIGESLINDLTEAVLAKLMKR